MKAFPHSGESNAEALDVTGALAGIECFGNAGRHAPTVILDRQQHMRTRAERCFQA